MISNKKIRLLGLSAFSIILIFILYHRNHAIASAELKLTSNSSKAQTLLTANNIIDSKNDEKLDDAINKELSKLDKDGEVSGSADDEVEDGLSNALDKTSSVVTFDPAKEFLEIRALSPMIVFSKTYCPYSKKLKSLLSDHYEITPKPSIVELDKHSHGAELQAYLAEITGRKTVPNVIVGLSNESKGGADDFAALHKQGKLLEALIEWGNKELAVKDKEAPSNL